MSAVDFDVAVVGGGPAGMAAALACAQAGLSVAVFERQSFSVDKACGEGLMPAGTAALKKLGVDAYINAIDTHRFESISFRDQAGPAVVGKLAPPYGLGIRRLALSQAFLKAAEAHRVSVFAHTQVSDHAQEVDRVILTTSAREFAARFLVAADGLHSPIRKRESMEGEPNGTLRFGLRKHFQMRPWSNSVEVTFADGIEAYVTPSGERRVGVAFLFDRKKTSEGATFDRLLSAFPALEAKLRGASADSTPRGSGPLSQSVTARVKGRVILQGDAAGYVDAITGEGLSLAFKSALALGLTLAEAKHTGLAPMPLARFERRVNRQFQAYQQRVNALLWLARHERLRRLTLSLLSRAPWLFGLVLRAQTRGL